MFQLFSKSRTKSSSQASASETGTSRQDQPPKSRAAARKRDLNSSPQSRRSRRASRDQRSKENLDGPLDLDIHPLNLPPEERERRRSALAPSEGCEAMDPDRSQDETITNEEYHQRIPDQTPTPPPHKSPTQSQSAMHLTTEAESYKAAGNKFFKTGDFQKAISEYSQAIQADPNNPTYLSNRSAAYMGLNHYDKALEDARQADLQEPGNPKIMLRLARIFTALGRPAEALSIYARIELHVAEKDTMPASAMQKYIEQATNALEEGNASSMALHALDQAEKGLGPGVEKPRAWRLLRGEAYLKMRDVRALADAQNVAMSLLRLNNQDPDALVLRGRIMYAQGENDKAIQHFRQALSFDPDLKLALKYLRMVQQLEKVKEEGNVAFKAGRYQEACQLYGSALEIDPTNRGTNSKILQNRALASLKLKEYTCAIDDCTKALELDSSYIKARKTKARALGESGDWEAAVKEYKAIAESNPTEPGIAKDIRHAELELKKSKRKDYYKILGISKDAGEGEIKRAYRKLAIVLHPDKNPGDADAEHKFKELGEAYETLSDPQKRSRYDNGEDLIDPSEMFGGGMSPFGGGNVSIDPEMLFNMMGGMGSAGMGGGRGGPSFTFSTGGSPFGGGSRQRQGGFPGGFGF